MRELRSGAASVWTISRDMKRFKSNGGDDVIERTQRAKLEGLLRKAPGRQYHYHYCGIDSTTIFSLLNCEPDSYLPRGQWYTNRRPRPIQPPLKNERTAL